MSSPDLPAVPFDAASPAFAGVALDLPVDRLFTYRVPASLRAQAAIGHRVFVPFRGRARVGIVAAVEARAPAFDVLDIQEAPDPLPLLDEELLSLGRFIARYYGCSLGEALAAMLPSGVRRRGKGARRQRVMLTSEQAAQDWEATGRSTEAQQRVLRRLRQTPAGYILSELCRAAHVSASPVQTLARHGVLTLTVERTPAQALDEAAQASEPGTPHDLSAAQAEALAAIRVPLAAQTYAAFLLLGVTGSGKTEVYLQAIEACRAQGRQAIVLVPEIALTPQTVRRFRARFERVAVLHSGQTQAERAAAWRRTRAGDVDVVIGPRSAVFAPLPRLGLLVVDEEHETSFKQQNAPRYHARDVGLVRARNAGAVVVLGSATPALESYQNALTGRYGLLRLSERVAGRSLPTVQVVDLKSRDERRSAQVHVGRTLEIRITEALRQRGQVILLQNRRGYATSVACPRCGFVVNCKHCDVALTWHRSGAIALCHLCGHEAPLPQACPDCALPRLELRGVGTQTVEQELAQRFPEARVARMDSDSMATRDAYEDVLGRFGRGAIDILVGTQMIAKGLDFPNVLLVGIISADTSLALPDFRASERTFGLLAQVAGRAGRGDVDGRVVVQTRMPAHPAIELAARQDYEAFARVELADRERFGYPPTGRLLRVVFRGKRADAVEARARATHGRIVAAATDATRILGPAVPPVARVQGLHRRHLLVKAPGHREVADVLRCLRAAPRPRGGIEELWDVDPLGVL